MSDHPRVVPDGKSVVNSSGRVVPLARETRDERWDRIRHYNRSETARNSASPEGPVSHSIEGPQNPTLIRDPKHGIGERIGHTINFENGVKRDINGALVNVPDVGRETRSVHHGARTHLMATDYHPDGTIVSHHWSRQGLHSVTRRPDGTVEGRPLQVDEKYFYGEPSDPDKWVERQPEELVPNHSPFSRPD